MVLMGIPLTAPAVSAQSDDDAVITDILIVTPDSDRDGLFDSLVIQIEVRFNVTDTFRAKVLIRDPTTSATILEHELENYTGVTPGRQTYSYQFPGPAVFGTQYDGTAIAVVQLRRDGNRNFTAVAEEGFTLTFRGFFSPDNFPVTNPADLPTLERQADGAIFRTRWMTATIKPNTTEGLTVLWRYNQSGYPMKYPQYQPEWRLSMPAIIIWRDDRSQDRYFQLDETLYRASIANLKPIVIDIPPTGRDVSRGDYAQYALSYNTTLREPTGGAAVAGLRFNVTFTLAAAGYVVGDMGPNSKVRARPGIELKMAYRFELERPVGGEGLVLVQELGINSHPRRPDALRLESGNFPVDFELQEEAVDPSRCSQTVCFFQNSFTRQDPQVANYIFNPAKPVGQAFYTWSSYSRVNGTESRVQATYLHTGPTVRLFLAYLYPTGLRNVMLVDQDPSVGVIKEGFLDWKPPPIIVVRPDIRIYIGGLALAVAFVWASIRYSIRQSTPPRAQPPKPPRRTER